MTINRILFAMAALVPICQGAERVRSWTAIGSAGVVTKVARSCQRPGPPVAILLSCPQPTPPPPILDRFRIGMADVGGERGAVSSSWVPYDHHDTVTIVYNVTAVDGLFPTAANGFRMTVNYLDTGEHSSVAAKLVEYDLASGTTRERLAFDSGTFPDSPNYQSRAVSQTGEADLDFSKKAYYVEVEMKLVWRAVGSLALAGPRLAAIRVERAKVPTTAAPGSLPEPGSLPSNPSGVIPKPQPRSRRQVSAP